MRATHASYFLMQSDLSHIAVMRKEGGEAKFMKPKDSAMLRETLEDFVTEEIEVMHRSDEPGRMASVNSGRIDLPKKLIYDS